MEPRLAIRDLVVLGDDSPIVDGLDLALPAGGVLGLIGPSGSGKSTLLEAIAGVRPVDRGEVLVDGRPVDRRRVGIATQEHGLLGGLTAAENVVVRRLAQDRRATGWVDVPPLLARLGLPESSWHNLAEQLSGGQQQRVAVARALLDAPPLVCLDDPVSELDETTAEVVWAQIATAAERGSVVVVARPDAGGGLRWDRTVLLSGRPAGGTRPDE